VGALIAIGAMLVLTLSSQLSLAVAPVGGGLTPVEHLPGVVDVAGPRADGRLVVSAGRNLFLLDRARGDLQPFASGAGGYPPLPGDEPYLAVSSGRTVISAGCSFTRDDVFVIDQAPHRVWRISGGRAKVFATVDGVDSLSGITFDDTGRFGNRLLLIGPSHGLTVVAAVDCRGAVTHVTDAAPAMEGGMVVAPASFGAFAGDLIAPDELSGVIRAVRPDGSTAVVAVLGLPRGQDTGIEGLGFVPAGFTRGGAAYFADRSTPGNRYPGTGSLLSVDSVTLVGSGVRDGDLLGATEGGARTVAVRCDRACLVTAVAQGPVSAHGEGHLLVVADRPLPGAATLPPAPDLGAAARTQALLIRAGLAALGVAGFVLLLIFFRRTRRRMS
jgi:hypothetical protein